MNEVSCTPLEIFWRNLETVGAKPEDLAAGLGYPLAHLQNPRRRIDWSAFVQFCSNAERYWSPEQLEELGGRLLRGAPSMRWVGKAARLLFSLRDFYHWATSNSGPTGRYFRTLDTHLEEVSVRRLRIVTRLKPGYEPCPAFFRVCCGNLRALPTVMGLAPARVEAQLHARGATYTIDLPTESARRPWLRRALLEPLGAVRSMAHELVVVYEAWSKTESYRHTLFEGVRDAILVIGDDGAILDANGWACRSLGYSHRELRRLHVEDLVVGDGALETLARAADSATTAQATHRRKDGGQFPVESRVVQLEQDRRRVWLVLARDVTEQHRLQRLRQQLLGRTLQTQERERQSLARELHDTTSQSLTSTLLGLGNLERELAAKDSDAVQARIDDLRQITRQSLDDVQRLVRGLRPSILDDLGFLPAIERLCGDFSRAHGSTVDIHKSGLEGEPVPPHLATPLYRVVQEALTNIARHADARIVSLVIEARNSSLRLIIEDDGQGFDPNAATSGFGLIGMRERIALLGGELTIESSAGHGTTIYVEVPLDEPPPDIGETLS